jgi:parallel beta-helix repeat protein
MSTSTAFFSFNKYPIAVALLAFILTACGGGDDMLSLSGTMLDSNGAPVPNATVTVHSDPVVVHTDKHGAFSCRIRAGNHHIRAEKEGRVFLDKDFTASRNGGHDHHDLGELRPSTHYVNATLTGIAITPSVATVAIGLNTAFTATATYSDATTADLTSKVTWSSADTAIATINTSTGIATGVALGGTSVSASFSGITAPTASLTVEPVIPPPLDPVTALFPANGNWNDYVAGNDWKTATDVACVAATDTACLHGGELRVVVATGQTSCSGLTAADDLGAFNWECDASTNPVRLVSTRLADGKNLSDLIDFVTPGFKANKVTVYANGSTWNTTPSSTWWTNPVEINNNGGDLITPSTIYLVTSNPAAAIILYADKIALVIEPGVTITGPNTGGNVITSTNNPHLWLEGNIDASAYNYGAYLSTLRFSMLRKMEVDNGLLGGVVLETALNNTLMGVTANNTGGTGVNLTNSMNNTLKDVTASNNTVNGVSLGGTKNIITSMTASNNGVNGVYLNIASNNTLADVTASNNVNGVNLSNSTNNIITSMTVSNNSGMGVTLFPASNNTIAGMTASNNNLGVYLRTASYNTLADVTSSNNATGVYLYSSSFNTFSGLLKVGNNTSNCTVGGTGTNPGLVTGTCAANGNSTATNDNTITLANSFVGKVTSADVANASDTSGTASFPLTSATFDWGHFANSHRGWGGDGSVFPNVGQRGRWAAGTGRIWDWSLLASDVANRGALSLPTGDNTMTHTWSDATTTTFLRNAVEIAADGIGNDNGLCESGETCRFTPNIGSYQGSGNLVSAGTFTDGSLTGITLMKYATNGEAAQP